MRSPLLLVALALAGCAGGGHHAHGDAPDTGDIAAGTSATLVFPHAGEHVIHCHPHPWMEQLVRVAAGGAAEAHVHVLDGEAVEEYRFDPPALDLAPGALVTYHNHGALVHTATLKDAPTR